MLRRQRGTRRRLLKKVLAPASLFTIALVVRLLPWPTVVSDDRIAFFGMDAWYHMRRVLFSLATGGETLDFDPYLNFPHGAEPIWSPLFDGFAALLLYPIYAFGEWRSVEIAAASLPPVLGAACVVATWRLASALFGRSVAALAGLLLSFLSAHYWYSQLGFVDHHVATALLTAILLTRAIALLDRLSAEAPTLRETWTDYAVVGAVAGFALLLWPGMVLDVGLVVLGLLAFTATRPDRDGAARVATGTLLTYGVAFALVLLCGRIDGWPQFGDYSPVVLSRFQPFMFAGLALHASLCVLLWSRTPLGASERSRAAQSLAIGAVLLLASAAALPGLSTGAGDAWQWFTKDEVFQSLVNESKPLFLGESGFSTADARLRLSDLLWAFPFAVVALAWHAVRSPRRPALLLLLSFGVTLALATLLQRRFFNSFAPIFAVVTAWACLAAVRHLPPALRSPPRRRAISNALAVVLGASLFAPTLAAYRMPLENLRRDFDGEALTVPHAELARRRMLAAADWLREATPPTSGYVDSDATPEYGVLAPWGYGHLLNYVAQRPTVVGNFGDDVGERNLRRVEAYSRSSEPDAVGVLRDLKVRYVVVEPLALAGPRQLARNTMRSRLSLDDSPGLEHHRLLWESPLDGEPGAATRSEVRIFEYVRGALVEGAAPPGARVHASLRYVSNRDRSGIFETTVEADETGRYRMRLPYSTHGAPPGVSAEPAFLVRSGGRVARMTIDERSVALGLTVAGPTFAAE